MPDRRFVESENTEAGGAAPARGRRGRFYLWLSLVALAAVGAAATAFLRYDPRSSEVRALVTQLAGAYPNTGEVPAYQALAALGAEAYPELSGMLRAHSTGLDRLEAKVRNWLPAGLTSRMPARASKDQIRQHAQAAVFALGPVAARALVTALHDSVRWDPGASTAALLCLHWSVPDSREATEAIGEWLSKPGPHQTIFGVPTLDEFWAQIPEVAPLLKGMLEWPDQARFGAHALGAMGPKAELGIPQLIQTFDHGMLKPPAHVIARYNPGLDPCLPARCAAMEALGDIGLPAPDVLAAIQRGWTDAEPQVQVAAADALFNLGPKAVRLLPELLGQLNLTNREVLEYQIEAIGQMGPAARPAIPLLRRWAAPSAVEPSSDAETSSQTAKQGRAQLTGSMQSHWRKQRRSPMTLPAGAAVALLQIAPDQARGLGEVIAPALLPGPAPAGVNDSVAWLRRLRPLAGELVHRLEPALHDARPWARQLTAYRILCLQPGHPAAKTVLIDALQQPSPFARGQAAVFYARVSSENQLELGPLQDVVRTVSQVEAFELLDLLGDLGLWAKPLIPDLKALLNRRDRTVRLFAGCALRRITQITLTTPEKPIDP